MPDSRMYSPRFSEGECVTVKNDVHFDDGKVALRAGSLRHILNVHPDGRYTVRGPHNPMDASKMPEFLEVLEKDLTESGRSEASPLSEDAVLIGIVERVYVHPSREFAGIQLKGRPEAFVVDLSGLSTEGLVSAQLTREGDKLGLRITSADSNFPRANWYRNFRFFP